MGVLLTPIVVKEVIALADLRGDVDGVVRFLCDEHAFGRDRVIAALERAFGPEKLF